MGIWDGASQLLLTFLEFLYGITHSYGLAIVILTLIVRVALYPLNQKQMVSMQHMQKIQPMLKVIQEKYGHDREMMNRETMRLYKEYKVNPAAGCLPILVQLPILILLFRVLNSYDFAGTTFFGVVLGSSATAGLAQAVGVAPGPEGIYSIFSVFSGIFANPAGLANAGLYLGNLILLIAISFMTWAQQKLSGAGNNPQMAMMNTIMPIFMAFICLSMPGGVMLYWGLSSIIGIAQQYFVMKKTKEQLAVKPTLHKNKPVNQRRDDEYDDDDDDDDDDEE